MRNHACRVFEIVAWPVAAWCAVELVVRTSTANFDGVSASAITGACAVLTITAARIRTRQFAAATTK